MNDSHEGTKPRREEQEAVPLHSELRAFAASCEPHSSFLSDLIAPCVMECDDREHMAERDLFFLRAKGPAAYQPRATPHMR